MTQTRTIEDRIRGFLLRHFPLARKNGVQGGEKLLETGLLDSLGVLDLVGFLEKEFSIRISDEELLPDNFQSLDAVVAFVQVKKPGSNQAGSIVGQANDFQPKQV